MIRLSNPLIGAERRLILISVLFSILVNTVCAQSIPADSRYLGQSPPGNTPVIFPLFVNRGYFAAERIAISADGREIYYSEIQSYYPLRGSGIKKYTLSDGKWTGPSYLFEGYAPSLSVSGDTMYLERDNSDQKYETYISVRNGHGWTKPERILTHIETTHYFQATRRGNCYVSSLSGNGAGLNDWCVLKITGSDTTVTSLGKPLNTDGENLDYFVSMDESYMIVTNRPGLAISFRNDNGSWTNPVNFGPKINFGLGSWGPYITPDNKYLFYTTGTRPDYSDVYVYWVRIDNIIDSIKATILN